MVCHVKLPHTRFPENKDSRLPHSLFNGGDVFRLNLSFREELGGYSPLKQKPLFGHLDQDEPNQLAHVHPAGHFFKPEGGKRLELYL